jgi:hypothetical protein
MNFKHLKYVKQGYFEHLIDALSYSFVSLKASIYFFIHGLYPDLFEFDGSTHINNLNTILTNKKKKITEQYNKPN